MIETRFKAGVRYLWNKPNDAIGALSGALVANVGNANTMTYDGLDSHLGILDPSLQHGNPRQALGIGTGLQTIAHTWLDYAPGRSSYVAHGGLDVLSGYMSGCLIIRGTYAGGMKVMHVGTIVGNTTANKKVRAQMARELPSDATGFNPAGAWTLAEGLAKRAKLGTAAGTPNILALVTTAGTFHAILMLPVQENGQWTNLAGQKYWCVGGIKTVPALNRVRLMAQLMS